MLIGISVNKTMNMKNRRNRIQSTNQQYKYNHSNNKQDSRVF